MRSNPVWYVISDVHLGTRRADQRGVRPALAGLVDHLAEQVARGDDLRLVLLGDLFDLADRGTMHHDPVARLRACADLNREVIRALGAAVGAGLRVHVVCGNHDLELACPDVWTDWVRCLGVPSGTTRVVLHPWFLHVPDVLFAEHGHQHHALSRSPTALDHCSPGAPRGVARPPLRVWTDGAGQRLGPRLLALAASVRHARAAEKRALSPDYVTQLARQARQERLPLDVVQDLVQVSRFRVLSAAAHVARQRLARRRGRRPGRDILCPAAARVSDALAAAGRRVPVVVFGHTHRAGLAALGTGSTYANCGTWTDDIRGPTPDEEDRGLFPVVVVDTQPAKVEVVIDYWDAPRQTWRDRLVPGDPTSREEPIPRGACAAQ